MREMTKRGTHDDTDTYFLLVQELPLRPIRNETDLARASAMADRLSERDDLEPAEEDYLEVLDGLIEQYEDVHHPIKPLPDADLIRELLDARGETQREMAEKTGIVYSTISSVVAGRRRLTREQLEIVADYFDVPIATFSLSK